MDRHRKPLDALSNGAADPDQWLAEREPSSTPKQWAGGEFHMGHFVGRQCIFY